MMDRLPANWIEATLGSFCDLINGRAFRPAEWSSSGIPIIRIQNLRDESAPFNHFDGMADDRHLVRSGDLLFAWSGTPGTSFGAHVWHRGDAILNQHIYKVVFDPYIANAEFLRLGINARLPELIGKAKGGAGLKHLNRSMVEAISIRLPPREEQDRIVSALEATTGRLNTVEAELAELATAVPIIERAILTAALKGAGDEEAPKAKAQTAGAEAVPASWEEVRVDEAGGVLTGRQRSPKNHSGPSVRPYLRVANVLDDRIDVSDVMSMNFSDAEYERYSLAEGDILLNEGQSLDLVGRAAMFRGELDNPCFTNTLIRFRPGPRVNPHFALLVFRQYQKSGRFREIAKITTNLAHLGTRRFAGLPFPLPSLEEQARIVHATQAAVDRIRAIGRALDDLRTDAKTLVASTELAALQGRLSQQAASEPPLALSPKSDRSRKVPRSRLKTAKEPGTAKRKPAMVLVPVANALKDSGSALEAQELFRLAGYPDDATVHQVEQFYMDLRRALTDGHIRREVTGAVERFAYSGDGR